MAEVTPKEPNLFHRLLIAVSRILPYTSLGLVPGAARLVLRRIVMQDLNLYPAPVDDTSQDGSAVPSFRTPIGDGNDSLHYAAGASNTAFGRNMPPAERADPFREPAVQVVAAKLLQRDKFKPAGDQLNVLAAAWIQSQAHDWFGHFNDGEDVELDKGSSVCPMKSFRFKSTRPRGDGAFDNFRTHWWDASFVYGQNAEAVARARTGKGGHMHVSDINGALPRDGDGKVIVGDPKDGWLGVALLQDIFLREHNAVVDAIANQHPELAEDDDKLFNYARLVVSAVVAKIHTVDWTVELLKNRTLDVGMNTNWYGLAKSLKLPFSNGPPGLFSLVATDTENHGVPYCLTEEFVSVYRLHSMLPDGLLLEGAEFIPLNDLVGQKGDAHLNVEGAPRKFWDSVISYPCGNLELFNYPSGLRDVPPTDDRGVAKEDHVDLAALDLYRDRERRLRNYNDFRRGLFMKPFKCIADLCGDDEKACKAMEEVYGKDGIEKVDLQVGMLAEKKIKGFAISETAFLIFLLMASRRLEADRFFTAQFDAETYSDVGFEWVKSVANMRDVLKRHFPEVECKIPRGYSAFKPYATWPADM